MAEEEKRIKMAVIAGAAHAIHFKNKHPSASEQEIIQYITAEVSGIIENIDK
jgi:hypothetical protein